MTVITAAGQPNSVVGTLAMGDHGNLSRLTVNNSGGSASIFAVYIPPSAGKVALEHVTLTASNPSNTSGTSDGF